MSIKVALEHRTTYDFAEPVSVAPHVVRLRPAPHTRTPIEAYTLDVSPKNHFLNWQQDPFGNWMARLVFPEKVKTLDIRVGLVADLMVINPFDFFVEEYAEKVPFAYESSLHADLFPYLRAVDDAQDAEAFRLGRSRSPRTSPAASSPSTSWPPSTPPCTARSPTRCGWRPASRAPTRPCGARSAPAATRAWLLVALLRQYGLAARFVSGYLVQLAADQEALDGPSGPAQDFTDLHAWAEVYIPGAGWVGMDPTSSLFAGEGHIPLSATPHPSSAAPIEGATAPVEVTFSFLNEVTRIHEDPRVTKPYTDEQWARIDALGEAVDERLVAGDVTAHHGRRADVRVPRRRHDPAVEHRRRRPREAGPRQRPWPSGSRRPTPAAASCTAGQGKWYPGEPLPRWNIALQWRTDGVAAVEGRLALRRPVGARLRRVGRGRAGRGARTPGHADPRPARVAAPGGLRGPARRARLRDAPARRRQPDEAADKLDAHGLGVLDADVDTPTGWVLPVVTGEEWTSPAWSFRRGRLVLLPGTSSVGLRLPLDSVAWKDPEFAGEPSYLEAGAPLEPQVPVVTVVEPEGGRHDGAGLRGARRPRARVPPADRPARRLRRPAPPGRGRGPQDRLPGRDRGLRPAARPAPDPARRHPRPRASSRSTCSRRRAGPSSATSPSSSTRRPARRA